MALQKTITLLKALEEEARWHGEEDEKFTCSLMSQTLNSELIHILPKWSMQILPSQP